MHQAESKHAGPKSTVGVLTHVKEHMSRFRGRLPFWDVFMYNRDTGVLRGSRDFLMAGSIIKHMIRKATFLSGRWRCFAGQ